MMNELDIAEPTFTASMLADLDSFVEIWEKDPLESGGMSGILSGIPPESIVAPIRPTSQNDLFIA